MSRAFWVGVLLVVACGGTEQGPLFENVGGSAQDGTTASAGAASAGRSPVATAGAESSAAGQPDAGGSPVDPAAGANAVGGSGGQAGTGVELGGTGAGVAGAQVGGAGGNANGGAAGTAGGPAGGVAGSGGGQAIVCPEGSLDCTGAPGCETFQIDQNNCGACGNKCFVSQKCVGAGTAGHLTAYCTAK